MNHLHEINVNSGIKTLKIEESMNRNIYLNNLLKINNSPSIL